MDDVFFISLSGLIFYLSNTANILALKMAFYYYSSKLINLAFPSFKMSVSLGDSNFKAAVSDIANHSEFIKAGNYFLNELSFAFFTSLIICLLGCFSFCVYLSKKGKKQSKNDYIKGRTLENNPKKLIKLMKKQKIDSDLIIGGVPIVKNSETQNLMAHGTVGTGKSTLINEAIVRFNRVVYTFWLK